MAFKKFIMTIKDQIWSCTFAYNPNREYLRATTEAHARRVANSLARTFGWGHAGVLRVEVDDCEAEEFHDAFDYRDLEFDVWVRKVSP